MMSSKKTYPLRIAKSHVFFITILPCLLLIFFFAFYFFSPNSAPEEDGWFELLFPSFLLIWTVGYWCYAYFYQLTLSQDSLQLTTIFGSKKIALEELTTYKIDEAGIHIFTKAQPNSPYFIITTKLEDTNLFITWLEQYATNPEWEEKQQTYEKERKEILKNDAYGKNRVEKEEKLNHIQQIAKWINGIALLNLIWSFLTNIGFLPGLIISHSIAFTIPFVLIYFSIKYKNFFTLSDPQTASHFPDISTSLYFSSLSLGSFWTFTNLYLYDLKALWPYAIGISLLVTLPLLLTARDVDYKKIGGYALSLFMVTIMLGYAYGSLLFFNLHCDTSPTQEFTAKVLNKQKGEGDSSSHYLTLSPWHTQKASTKIEVSLGLLEAVEVQEDVIIYKKEGALGFPYYGVYSD